MLLQMALFYFYKRVVFLCVCVCRYWLKILFRFFHKMLQKNPNERFN